MKRRVPIALLLLAWSVAAVIPPARAATPPAVNSGTIELPPMMVEESISSVPWLYVSAGGTEFLSRCSASTTRALVEGWLTKMQLVRAMIPEEFLARMDVPSVFVLYAQDLEQTVSAEIQRELQAGETPRGGGGVNIAPSMRLSDRDMHASIAYIDEALFDAATMSVSPGHVRFLLRGRVPELPTWLVEGLERNYRRADFVMDPITFRPLLWNSRTESDALANDATRPRAVLPGNELFATEAARAAEKQHLRRAEARSSTQELFVRWALTAGGPTREAFWSFAARAAESPVSEAIFERHFGFDYAELRDRLSDYLPKAVEETTRLNPGRAPPLPDFKVDRATPNQVARVRGEWERLAIGHVQKRLPQVREPYIAQARRTLRRAYDAGDRDPRLLATMGLCEIDAGNDAGAREFLEPAAALGVVRPRAYYELARLRFEELRRQRPGTELLSFTELAPIIAPLQRALTQAPPLPEVYALLGETWARCEMAPNSAEFAELETGARLFARRPEVAYPIAVVLTRHGRNNEALAVVEACPIHRDDEDFGSKFAQLRSDLAPEGTRPAGR